MKLVSHTLFALVSCPFRSLGLLFKKLKPISSPLWDTLVEKVVAPKETYNTLLGAGEGLVSGLADGVKLAAVEILAC